LPASPRIDKSHALLDEDSAPQATEAAIDAQIPNGHDDPLNFDIDSFARSWTT
jgi:hypothetical protein